LSPLPRHLILVAPLVPMTPFLIVTVTRRMLSSAVGYGLGLSYGQSGLRWAHARYPRVGRLLRMLERLFTRAAPLVLFASPGPLVCALAGVARMPRWLFVPLAVAGQILRAVLEYMIGEAIVEWTAPIVAFLKEHVLEATALCVLAVVVYRVIAVARRRERSVHAAFEPALPDEPPPQQDQA
jgi:membrane protein DedA with SNARE-associated domain